MSFTEMNKNRDYFKRQWMEAKKTKDKAPSEEILTEAIYIKYWKNYGKKEYKYFAAYT